MTQTPPSNQLPSPDGTPPHGHTRRTVLRAGVVLGAGTAATLTLADPAAAIASAGSLTFAHKGQTTYRIYLGAHEGVVVEQAARELADYLERITSATFPVVRAAHPPRDGHLIVVGRENPVTRAVAGAIDYDALADDGFALRTAGGNVLLTGASPRGTLYAAYWVLDRLFGVRWFSPDVTHVPRTTTLRLDAGQFQGDHVPRFRFREVLCGDANDAAYRQHNMLNGLRDQYWTVPRAAGIDTWSQYWPEDSPYGHFFHEVVTDQSLWANQQLKAMDPATRTAATNRLIELVQERIAAGHGASAAFIQQDAGWTPDPASQAFADAHGGALSAPMIDMVNEVADRVAAAIPGARLETEAYWWSFQPPTGMTVRDNVVVTVAPIFADFGHSLFAPENGQTGEYIRTWCAMAKNVVLWDYLTTFASYIQPFPNWWAMGEGIKTFAELPSAQGYFGEGAWNGSGTEFAHLRVWIISRLLWDPSLDVDKLIREFLAGYYGAAAEDVYQYMQVMRDSVARTNTYLAESVNNNAAYLNFETMREADNLLGRAQEAVQDDPIRLAHVQSIRLGVDYIILVRTPEFIRAAAAEGIAWDPQTEDRARRFETELRSSGLTRATEGGGTPEDLLAKVRVASAPATPPAVAAGLPDTDWVDYQEVSMNLYAPVTTILSDDRASNSYSVRMPGDHSDWGVQVNLGALPSTGTWKLYASVAADTGSAAPTSNALVAGVYPPFERTVGIPVSQLSDGEFHEVPLPGTYQNDPSLTAYLAPPNSPNIANVYVDRIVAVRAS